MRMINKDILYMGTLLKKHIFYSNEVRGVPARVLSSSTSGGECPPAAILSTPFNMKVKMRRFMKITNCKCMRKLTLFRICSSRRLGCHGGLLKASLDTQCNSNTRVHHIKSYLNAHVIL